MNQMNFYLKPRGEYQELLPSVQVYDVYNTRGQCIAELDHYYYPTPKQTNGYVVEINQVRTLLDTWKEVNEFLMEIAK